MLVIQGKQVFPAIATGPLAFFRKNTGFTALCHIKDTEAEVQRFQTARKISIEQLRSLYARALGRIGETEG